MITRYSKECRSIVQQPHKAHKLSLFFRQLFAASCYCYCYWTISLIGRSNNNILHHHRYKTNDGMVSAFLAPSLQIRKRTKRSLHEVDSVQSTKEQQEKGIYSEGFRDDFKDLLKLRRDVRRFDKDRPVSEDLLNDALHVAFNTAPSVGLSEPWRVVHIKSPSAREKVLQNFLRCNEAALEGYEKSGSASKSELYASLKLSGMKEAPIQLAIFCDEGTSKGSGLGAQSMPEMRRYSVVCAIQSFWLLARSVGLGVGWVSILDPKQLKLDLGLENRRVLDSGGDGNGNGNGSISDSDSDKTTDSWKLVGYLCVGYPDETEMDGSRPELERFGWEERRGKQSHGMDDRADADNDVDVDDDDDFHFYRELPIIVL